MMTLSKFPLFLRFSVRMLFCQLFFIALFIKSQTPFSYSDSTIFISEDAYLYVESPVDISATMSLSGNYKLEKQFPKSKNKAFFKLNAPTVSKNQINPSKHICFTAPKSSHYIINSNNLSSTAVLGHPFQIKQHQKITGSAFWILPQVIVSEKKLLYNIINHFHILKIITNHFSRPPPAAIRSKGFLTHQSHER